MLLRLIEDGKPEISANILYSLWNCKDSAVEESGMCRTCWMCVGRVGCVGRAYFMRISAQIQRENHNSGDIMEKCQ